MLSKSYTTNLGISIEVLQKEIPFEGALDPIFQKIDTAKGAIFSSGFDYPGRHSRWEIGFINPALEFIAKKSKFQINSLNQQGTGLIIIIAAELKKNTHLINIEISETCIKGEINRVESFFTEEDRSRQASIFSILRTLAQTFHSKEPEASHLGLYGAFGYDLVFQFEQIQEKIDRSKGDTPDCHLYLPLEITVVDRKKELATIFQYSVKTPLGETKNLSSGGETFPLTSNSISSEVTSDHQPGEFAKKVEKVIEGTAKGDYFEVVLSQTFSTGFEEKPTTLFQRMASINPSPYMFLINFGQEQLIGASPELYARVTGNRYETCPIAGTIRRGATALEDADKVFELISSRKDESELTMCTDVDRNDMARVCVPGSVKVIGRRQLEFYSHLIHTVDHLEGYLQDKYDALDAFQTHMWACTVTGAPKPAALQEIENLEKSPRGWYSGAIGMLCFNGSINTGITLRTAVLKNGMASLRAGATILHDSNPELEELETRTKAAALLSVLTNNKQEKITSNENSFNIKLRSSRKILLVDYRDSFVHNLAAYLRELGADVTTIRCGFDLKHLQKIKPDLVFLSPGPGTPEEFGVPDFVGELVKMKFPICGVCLGHQGIGQHFGGKIAQLPLPVHGKVSIVEHNNNSMFAHVEQRFEAGRYHSLYIKHDTLPGCLELTAHTLREEENGKSEIIPMAFRHKTLPIASVQFHPESLMTLKKNAGHHIINNIINELTK